MAGVITGNYRNQFVSDYDALKKLEQESAFSAPTTSVSKLDVPNLLNSPAKSVGFDSKVLGSELPGSNIIDSGGDYNFGGNAVADNKILGMEPMSLASVATQLASALAPQQYDKKGNKIMTWQESLAKSLSSMIRGQQTAQALQAGGAGTPTASGGNLLSMLSALLGGGGTGNNGGNINTMNLGGGGFS
jgi:hypothetical protein